MESKANVTIMDKALTKEAQDLLTPDSVLQDFVDGNNRFMNDIKHTFDHKALLSQTVDGQFPKAVVLSCIDSRVPVELIFDQSIGDIFVARVAGNIINGDVLGSMEYSCKVAGSKLVFVLGHQSCGAVKAACDHVELGNITGLLDQIQPAVSATETEGEKNSSNAKFVADVTVNNVLHAMDRIRKESPILAEMEEKGEIKIVGGVYFLENGKVELI